MDDQTEAGERCIDSAVEARLGPPTSEVETTDVGAGAPAATSPALAPGQRVGRYLVLEVLGAGAMGVVYQAYDPELQRPVALKVVNPAYASRRDPAEGRRRLLAEARSLAKLTHPNVTIVHDVGEHEGSVWLAMELVEGEDLKRWLQRQDRTWSEVVDVFVGAAKGLAAAHAAGIVHRDFKPANVLIGRDGRTRISDFGIARVDEAPDDTSADLSQLGPSDEAMTRAGMVMGTPAYMAPEQHRGQAVGPAADQFAFCVALYEALYGERPFLGRRRELLAAKESGAPEPPHEVDAPPWLWELVRTGLAAHPDERHDSMRAVAEALQPSTPKRGRSRALVGAVALSSIAVWGWARQPPSEEPCTGGDARFAEIYDAATARHVNEVFAATGHPEAERIAAGVAERLASYGESWSAAHHDACVATRVRGEQSETMLGRRMACLDSRRREVGALLEVFESADRALVGKARSAVAKLSFVGGCANVVALQRGVEMPADPSQADAIAAAKDTLAAATALWRAGRLEAADTKTQALLETVEQIGWAPLTAEAFLQHARLLDDSGEFEASIDRIKAAAWLAQQAGDDRTFANAAISLTFMVGEHQNDALRALEWGQLAEATLERIGGDAELQMRLAGNRAIAYDRAGRFEEAHDSYRRTLQLQQDIDADDASVSVTLQNFAASLVNAERASEALPIFDDALRLAETVFGPDNVHTAYVRHNRAGAMRAQGDPEAAMNEDLAALAVFEREFGADNAILLGALVGLASSYQAMSRLEDALATLERARVIAAASDPYSLPIILNNLGHFETQLGRDDQALDHLTRSLAEYQARSGPQSPSQIAPMMGLARLHGRMGRIDQALTLFHRARALVEDNFGADHPDAKVCRDEIAALVAARDAP